MILFINREQRVPQADEFLFHNTIGTGRVASGPMLPQVGIGTGIKESGEQAVAEHFLDRLLHLGGEVVAAQATKAV